MSAHTVSDVQQALLTHGYLASQADVDGQIGPVTTAAVLQFQANNGITPADGTINAKTLDALFGTQPATTPVTTSNAPNILAGIAATFKLPNIGASLEDYALNFLQSKINWFTIVGGGALVTFIQTHFGLSIPDAFATQVETWAATALGALIVYLRTFHNQPVVATALPKAVTSTATAGVSNTAPTPAPLPSVTIVPPPAATQVGAPVTGAPA